MRPAPAWFSVRAAALVAGLCVACADEAPDETPAGTVVAFLDAMDRSAWDDAALEEAYGFLAPESRAALEARAARASALAQREFHPWQMLAQGRFRRRFMPRREGGMRERIEGNRATVTVLGTRDGERSDVPLVLEGDRWRVALEIPPAE